MKSRIHSNSLAMAWLGVLYYFLRQSNLFIKFLRNHNKKFKKKKLNLPQVDLIWIVLVNQL